MSRYPAVRVAWLATLVVLCFSLPVRAVEIDDDEDTTTPTGKVRVAGTRKHDPEVNAASDEGAQALKRMQLPHGLEAKLWAAEPMLANPVAINFDERGRLFVAETYRYRTSTLDIRDYMWMLEDELACRTLDDRVALIKRSFGAAGEKELSIESEQVRLLEDTKHAGVADRSTVYADNFRSELDGIASGVLARRGEVWFTNIPSLWKFTGVQKAETRTELSRGYGVRFNFTGHDLHGLVFGPDGKIYFSSGDRGAHATAIDGSTVDSPDMGAVFRCNPDGTQLELFAWGLRNPEDLLFNEYGDLFTGDNDCDQGDEERLIHVVEGGDSGWRIGYQFPPLEKNSPWLADKLWVPRFKDQATYLLPAICNIEDGPSGIAYYPGTGLNPSYAGSIFITHFKGSIAKSGIYAYNVKPSGASYAIADAKPFLTNSLPTDVKFGPDGRLYYSDWAEGWPKSKRGRIYAISDPAHAKDTLVQETEQTITSDFTQKSSDELAALLGHADWRVRLEAQYTLAERGAASLPVFTRIASSSAAVAPVGQVSDLTRPASFARLHAIWGLGQLAAKNPVSLTPLRTLIHDAEAEVRAQSLKILGDYHPADLADIFVAALQDPSNRVKFFAAQGLGKFKYAAATPALLAALRANDDVDPYLRHALVMGLVGCATSDALAATRTDASRAVRLGSVLALRRLGAWELAPFLADRDPLVARETALAINDVPIPGAQGALAAFMATQPKDETIMVRVLNAHFRLGAPDNARALAAYASLPDASPRMRAEALAQLALWPKPPQRDRLVGIYRPLPDKTRDATVARDALAGVLPGLLNPKTPAPVQAAALAAMVKLEFTGTATTLYAVVANSAQPAATRTAALNAMDKLNHPQLAAAVKLAGESNATELRLAALTIAARLSPDTAAPVLANLVTKGTVDEQKTAFKALGTLKHPLADTLLLQQLAKLAAGEVPPAVQLELLTAAGKRDHPGIKKLLAERDAALKQDPDPLAPYRVALEGGDKARGMRIFNTQPVMACVRCHRVGNESGGEAGPNLAEVGAKHPREYLLESVIKPNAKIAPGYDTVVVTLKSGGATAGIVVSDTADTLTLRDTDSKLHAVQKSDIARREGAPSAMPEIFGMILTKAEIRDVIAYLASLTEKPSRPEDTKPRALRHLGE